MKYKSIANPKPTPGVVFKGEKLVVPNQAISLQEILERFTRNEALPIGKEPVFHESEDDLEKISKADLVDKAEFSQKLIDTQKKYEKQEKARKKKIEEEERAKIAAELAAKEKAKGSEPPAQ